MFLILVSAFILLIGNFVFGKDIIVDKEGNRTEAIVEKITPEEIEYRKLSNPHGPLYVIKRCTVTEIEFENGNSEHFTETCEKKGYTVSSFERFSVSFESKLGLFGLFNVDDEFTKAKFTFGVTPSFLYRCHKNIAIGIECMFLWGQTDTTLEDTILSVSSTDPLRLIINPNLRTEVLFPIHPNLTLELITAAGFSIWPKYDTTGVLHPTFFYQRGGWNARAAFGIEWKFRRSVALLCNVGYSANSSENDDVWITHDMMMVSVGVRYGIE